MKIKLIENPDSIIYKGYTKIWSYNAYPIIVYKKNGKIHVINGDDETMHKEMEDVDMEIIDDMSDEETGKSYGFVDLRYTSFLDRYADEFYYGRVFMLKEVNVISFWKQDRVLQSNTVKDINVLQAVKDNLPRDRKDIPCIYEIWDNSTMSSSFVPIDTLPPSMNHLETKDKYTKWSRSHAMRKTTDIRKKDNKFDFSYYKYKDMRANPELYFDIKG